jgi:hypothetical protein
MDDNFEPTTLEQRDFGYGARAGIEPSCLFSKAQSLPFLL